MNFEPLEIVSGEGGKTSQREAKLLRGGITIYYLFLGYYKGELKILRKNLFSRGVSKLFCQFFTPSFSEG